MRQQIFLNIIAALSAVVVPLEAARPFPTTKQERPEAISIKALAGEATVEACAFSRSEPGALESLVIAAGQPLDTKLPFVPFTGKIIRNKVRLRLQPNVESEVVRELSSQEMLLVTGEENSFYVVTPPEHVKAFVFRTFVLDDKIEGHRVNVRLKPDLESPIIGQLNAGDPVNGRICPSNNKWVEIDPPATVRFYVAKEFVEKVGDAQYLPTLQCKKAEATRKLDLIQNKVQQTLSHPCDVGCFDEAIADCDALIACYKECPQQVEKAKELKLMIQEACLQQSKKAACSTPVEEASVPVKSSFSTVWKAAEQARFEQWAAECDPAASMQDFYQKEKQGAVALRGVVQPFNRPLKNKPGDYLLVDKKSHIPIAYLYSTIIDLQEQVGKEIVVLGAPRPNNHFAYPAFHAMAVE